MSSFWDSRYRQQVTPWESGQLPAGFAALVPTLLPRVHSVLLPGCGSGYEVAYLQRQGLRVAAIDFSAEAVARARQQLGPLARLVRQADFFGDEVDGSWDWVYERAFLCALPPSRWPAYAEKMAQLVKPGGYLAGYFFLRPTLKGPPFGAALTQLQALFQPWFSLQQQTPVSGSLPVFAPDEYWLCWQRSENLMPVI
ncbi:methyltransferase domain-containing protein [Vogesella fluminis]|uniref:Methyltransferase domain-containing protein n=1 Tax=Vogesella fluminis TaxID=1069161 RepID=A0ABQ3H8B1_9NEIS|nr:methyltransferase domain-containing protein [Vogesella fluminis]GHD72322.1 hypothetical protein GCM10011419_05450 [Vogesella fluminis]